MRAGQAQNLSECNTFAHPQQQHSQYRGTRCSRHLWALPFCRADDWAAKRADAAAQKQLKAKSSRREVFKRAEAYAKEYRSQVRRSAICNELSLLFSSRRGWLGDVWQHPPARTCCSRHAACYSPAPVPTNARHDRVQLGWAWALDRHPCWKLAVVVPMQCCHLVVRSWNGHHDAASRSGRGGSLCARAAVVQ